MRLPATLLSRWSRSQYLGSAIGRDACIRVFKKDLFLMGSSRERSCLGYHLNRFSSLASSRLMNYRFLIAPSRRYIVCIPFVGNDFLPSATIEYKFCPPHRNSRSIMTGVSVGEEEVTRAFELFLSTEKDETLSTKEICSIYIERLCRSGKLSDAVCLLRLLHGRQVHLGLNIYNILLSAAGDANNFNIFSEIFKNLLLSSLPPDLTSYVNVAKAFQKVADSGLVLKFVREVSEITIHRDPTVINRMIFVTARSGQINKSMMIFEDLKNLNCKMDKVTFNTVLGILGKAGQVDQMLSVFTSMKDCGHTPDIVTYNTLVNCLRRLGRLDLCRTFAREMVENGIQLDLQTYTALIDGFGRTGHAEDALNIFHEMKKSLHPSIYVYRALINNLKKAGKFECALNLYAEMNSSTSKLVGPEDFRRKRQTRRHIKQVETGES
ncbi:pentatricopeptide repeat-containing protein At1g11900 isoform X1 [Phoenix dactylifera]|uniref:Pentatricopeptide repeat-containing protein At1g11900 isoform X1 n=1 Tax=Phoenix dactylifera TaxID=42345 RepID=A0A8B9A2G9_PHODC|nr:pentatricopeptide repeat-containing protein At1g11900 isoform X1 [Phoenix dactylifera]